MAARGRSACRPWRTRSSRVRSPQGVVGEVLSAVYEVDFVGFAPNLPAGGFRPGRNPHTALDALHTAIMSRRVNRVLDADIRSFFAEVDHEWHLRMLAHRIADPRILKLPASSGWRAVAAGRGPRERRVHGNRQGDEARGTPQGADISPPLANIVLHYVLDPGSRCFPVQQWRRRRLPGRVVIGRYADDFVIGFQREADARAMPSALGERLASYGGKWVMTV